MSEKKNMKSGLLDRKLKELAELGRCAAAALKVSDGEFWVWYGSPFLLRPGTAGDLDHGEKEQN